MTKLAHIARAVGHLRRVVIELRDASADLGTPHVIIAGRVLAEMMAHDLAALLEQERELAKKDGGA